MIDKNPYQDLKKFFIKLISIVIGIIIVINVTYNLIFAEKLESLNKILMLKDKKNIEEFKDKLRVEIEKGMEGGMRKPESGNGNPKTGIGIN